MNKNEIRQAFNESYYRINEKLWWLDAVMFFIVCLIVVVIGVAVF